MPQRSFAFASAASAASGPGWFDSSFDLHAGLDVVEADHHADLDLPSWIEVFLDGAAAQPPRAARVASPSAITAIA